MKARSACYGTVSALALVALSLGCASSGGGSTRPSEAPAPPAEPQVADVVRARLEASAGRAAGQAWVWVPAASGWALASGGDEPGPRLAFEDEVELREDGALRGALRLRPGRGDLLEVVVLAVPARRPGEAEALRELAEVRLVPAVDPRASHESPRLPFLLHLTPAGLALASDEQGERTVDLLGLISSEEGSAFVAYLRVRF